VVVEADELAGAVRSAWIAAIGAAVAVVVAAFFIAGLEGAGLALAGGVVGVVNLRFAAFALGRAPIAFLGSSLPRLVLITVALVVLVEVLGPVGVWGLLGLLATHLAQVGAMVRFGIRAASK
jgi:peptidoglycan biosynthesis protein MviN/MurJ (putative lipid II flippase)